MNESRVPILLGGWYGEEKPRGPVLNRTAVCIVHLHRQAIQELASLVSWVETLQTPAGESVSSVTLADHPVPFAFYKSPAPFAFYKSPAGKLISPRALTMKEYASFDGDKIGLIYSDFVVNRWGFHLTGQDSNSLQQMWAEISVGALEDVMPGIMTWIAEEDT